MKTMLLKMLLGVAVVWMVAGCLTCGERAALPNGFVHVTERVPDGILEVRYHSTYNFVGKRIDGYVTLKDEPYPDRYFDFPVR